MPSPICLDTGSRHALPIRASRSSRNSKASLPCLLRKSVKTNSYSKSNQITNLCYRSRFAFDRLSQRCDTRLSGFLQKISLQNHVRSTEWDRYQLRGRVVLNRPLFPIHAYSVPQKKKPNLVRRPPFVTRPIPRRTPDRARKTLSPNRTD